jgi:hypothetical protein
MTPNITTVGCSVNHDKNMQPKPGYLTRGIIINPQKMMINWDTAKNCDKTDIDAARAKAKSDCEQFMRSLCIVALLEKDHEFSFGGNFKLPPFIFDKY